MSNGGIQEILYQFAGYFHIHHETARMRLEYEEFASWRGSDDFKPGIRIDPAISPFVEEVDPDAMRVPYAPVPPDLIGLPSLTLLQDLDVSFDLAAPGRLNLRDLPHPSAPAIAAGSSGPPQIHVTYAKGGNQLAIHADQENRLYDNDTVGLDAGMVDNREAKALAALDKMAQKAIGETPDDLLIEHYDTASVAAFIAAHDAAWKADGDHFKGEVASGTYINGVLQEEGAELPVRPESVGVKDIQKQDGTPGQPEDATTETELNGMKTPAQIAALGGNEAINEALIVDVSHATGTLVVVGDYFRTDAIIQFNAYKDNDLIEHAGWDEADISGAGNQAFNIATFLNTDAGVESFAGSTVFAGTAWNVDVFDGDLYDVKTLVQFNWFSDNDVTFQENYQSHYTLVAGSNAQGNFAQFVTFAGDYDVVIVLGDYHEANLIYQKNFLFDNDIIKMLGGAPLAGDGGEAAGSADAGGNWLMNQAVIEHFGTQSYQPLGDDWLELIQKLSGQEGTLDLSFATGIPNFGDGTLDILFVTGSVYDINLVAQYNMMADADTAMLYVPPDADGTAVGQDAATGGNALTNLAAIVTTDPAADFYIGGDQYADEILVQADIVASDNDDVVYGDTEALASELVAFTGPAEQESSEPQSEDGSQNDYLNSDLLSGMLT